MADPLSIAGSLVGIVALGAKVSISLFALAEAVSTASERVESIANDISSTCGILDSLRDLMKPHPGPDGTHTTIFNATALSDIRSALTHCQSIFAQISTYLKKATKQMQRITPRSTTVKVTLSRSEKAKWPFLQPQFQELRNDLRDSKINMLLMVAVANLAVAQKRGDGRLVDESEKTEMRATILRLKRAGTMEVMSLSDEEEEVGAIRRLFRRVVAWRIGRKQVESDDDEEEEGADGHRGLGPRSMAASGHSTSRATAPATATGPTTNPTPGPPTAIVSETDSSQPAMADVVPLPPTLSDIDPPQPTVANADSLLPPLPEDDPPLPTAPDLDPPQHVVPSGTDVDRSTQTIATTEDFPDIETVAGPSTVPNLLSIDDSTADEGPADLNGWDFWGSGKKKRKEKAPIRTRFTVETIDVAVQTSPVEPIETLVQNQDDPPPQPSNDPLAPPPPPPPPQQHLSTEENHRDNLTVDGNQETNAEPIPTTDNPLSQEAESLLQAWTSTILPGLTTGTEHSLAIIELSMPLSQIQSLLPSSSQDPSPTMDILRKLNPYQRRMILDHVQPRGAKLLHVDVWHNESVATVWGELDIVTLIWITSTTKEKLKAFEWKGWGGGASGTGGVLFGSSGAGLFGGSGVRDEEERKKAVKKGVSNEAAKDTKEFWKDDALAQAPPDTNKEHAPIKFKDCVGRKFSFPFDMVNTWEGIETLINKAFLHVEVIGPHVQEGHYDLVSKNGEIILPQIWERVIQPGAEITMHMWPVPERPRHAQNPFTQQGPLTQHGPGAGQGMRSQYGAPQGMPSQHGAPQGRPPQQGQGMPSQGMPPRPGMPPPPPAPGVVVFPPGPIKAKAKRETAQQYNSGFNMGPPPPPPPPPQAHQRTSGQPIPGAFPGLPSRRDGQAGSQSMSQGRPPPPPPLRMPQNIIHIPTSKPALSDISSDSNSRPNRQTLDTVSPFLKWTAGARPGVEPRKGKLVWPKRVTISHDRLYDDDSDEERWQRHAKKSKKKDKEGDEDEVVEQLLLKWTGGEP